MRAAVYTGTRNLYEGMIAAAKSILIHSNIDQIYFLIEDDEFPYELPPKVTTINISRQEYFPSDGPNFRSRFTYMALIRAALTKIFPNLDKILSLDVDTIINENISELWDINLSNFYFAACREPEATLSSDTYFTINAGVMMINLNKLRQDKKDDEIIHALNTKYYKFDVQDAYAEYCQQFIYELSPDYNVNDYTKYKDAKYRKIIHYAGIKQWIHKPLVQKYLSIPNNKLVFNQPDNYNLDIIIPSYNDEEGLIRTLNSIYYQDVLDWVTVTVIDDHSDFLYFDIMEQFPKVNFIIQDSNHGPGYIRNLGIKVTSNPYIMFVDCGDIILSKYCFNIIKDELSTNRMPDIYEWQWINEDTHKVSYDYEPSTPGKIYKREFLELYQLYPCSEGAGSYAAEDCGLNFTCYSLLEDFEYEDSTQHFKHIKIPIYRTVVNNNSLTFKNNKEFNYTSIPGIAENAIYYTKNCERLNIHTEIIGRKLSLYIVDFYKHFLKCIHNKPELAQKQWEYIRKFYYEAYSKYENVEETSRTMYFKLHFNNLNKYIDRPNIIRFINDIKTNESIPEHYWRCLL